MIGFIGDISSKDARLQLQEQERVHIEAEATQATRLQQEEEEHVRIEAEDAEATRLKKEEEGNVVFIQVEL